MELDCCRLCVDGHSFRNNLLRRRFTISYPQNEAYIEHVVEKSIDKIADYLWNLYLDEDWEDGKLSDMVGYPYFSEAVLEGVKTQLGIKPYVVSASAMAELDKNLKCK